MVNISQLYKVTDRITTNKNDIIPKTKF
uniref:Uncharacterized protein n=1 Tax=Rhizophora mucronata TaxID=61149 RepID=A0A2P2NLL1_RHIMU